MKVSIHFSIAVLVFAVGCSKKPHEEPTTEPTAAIQAPSAQPPAEPAVSAAAVIEDPDIEVPEDFADDAAEEITSQNLENELAALEKEINSDT
jgi:hypothetical protein